MPIKCYIRAFILIAVACSIELGIAYQVALHLHEGGAWLGWLLVFLSTSFVILFLLTHLLPNLSWFHPLISRLNKTDKILALTFDDGPNEPFTSQILEILNRAKVPATFFMLGRNLQNSSHLLNRMREAGHEIGNHTFSHDPLVFCSTQKIARELEAWEKLAGSSPWFRAPRGWKSPFLNRVLRKKGYRLVGWTRGVWDTDQPPADVLFKRLTRNLKNGEIILLHDGIDTRVNPDRSSLIEVLPRFLDFCSKKGFRFVRLDEAL